MPEGALFCAKCGTPASDKPVLPPQSDAFLSGLKDRGTNGQPDTGDFYGNRSDSGQPAAPTERPVSVPPPLIGADAAQVSAAGNARSEKKRVNGAVVAVFSVIFGILIFLCVLAAVLTAGVSTIVSEHRISQEIASSEISELVVGNLILDNDDIYNMFDEQEFEVYRVDEDSTVADIVVICAVAADLDADGVDKLFKKMKLMGYAGDVVASYEDYLLTGDCDNHLTSREIKNYIKKCEPSILSVAKYEMTDEDWDNIDKLLSEYRSDLSSVAPDSILGPYKGISTFVLSPLFIGIAIGVPVILTVLLMLITRSIAVSLRTAGIASLAAGILTAGAVYGSLFLLPSFIRGLDRTLNSFISDIIRNTVIEPLAVSAGVAAGAGFVLIIASVIISIVGRRKAG